MASAKQNIHSTEVVVIGSGPGGYTAAFRAADLGKQVTLVEYYDNLGGVCLNVGCIPSKALLHVANFLTEAEHVADFGLSLNKPQIDLTKLRAWKDKITKRLSQGLKGLAKQRKVTVINGQASFVDAYHLEVQGKDTTTIVSFQHAIIAAGSRAVQLPFIPDDPRIMDSTGALALEDIPQELLVIGGGIIGMELSTVYQALGSNVSVVELTPQILPGTDKDLVKPLFKRMSSCLKTIMLQTKVTKVEPKADGLWVTFAGTNAPAAPVRYDKILVAAGRVPNGKLLNAQNADVNVDERGFIPVNDQLQTNVGHIFAIGDIAGNPMLAHKAIPEGKVAAEVICGMNHHFHPLCIPSVAYTNPEVAWVGVTEEEAIEQKLDFGKGVFPWLASGRALTLGREEGFTKVIFDKATNKIIGAGIVGPHAGDLIAEATLAIEMGCDHEDLELTIHPHPTLSETICQATEVFTGNITDLYLPKG